MESVSYGIQGLKGLGGTANRYSHATPIDETKLFETGKKRKRKLGKKARRASAVGLRCLGTLKVPKVCGDGVSTYRHLLPNSVIKIAATNSSCPRSIEKSMKRIKLQTLIVTVCIATGSLMTSAKAALYQQGFETDVSGWMTPTRVASGTHGVTSLSGSFHAETAGGAGDFTRWGGYNFGAGSVPTAFQPYTTSLAIYLNLNGGAANDTRFDWSSAISKSDGTF